MASQKYQPGDVCDFELNPDGVYCPVFYVGPVEGKPDSAYVNWLGWENFTKDERANIGRDMQPADGRRVRVVKAWVNLGVNGNSKAFFAWPCIVWIRGPFNAGGREFLRTGETRVWVQPLGNLKAPTIPYKTGVWWPGFRARPFRNKSCYAANVAAGLAMPNALKGNQTNHSHSSFVHHFSPNVDTAPVP